MHGQRFTETSWPPYNFNNWFNTSHNSFVCDNQSQSLGGESCHEVLQRKYRIFSWHTQLHNYNRSVVLNNSQIVKDHVRLKWELRHDKILAQNVQVNVICFFETIHSFKTCPFLRRWRKSLKFNHFIILLLNYSIPVPSTIPALHLTLRFGTFAFGLCTWLGPSRAMSFVFWARLQRPIIQEKSTNLLAK